MTSNTVVIWPTVLSLFLIIYSPNNDNNKFTLDVYYSENIMITLHEDNELCCLFDFNFICNQKDFIQIRCNETQNILGTIYGNPTKKFLIEIYKHELRK